MRRSARRKTKQDKDESDANRFTLDLIGQSIGVFAAPHDRQSLQDDLNIKEQRPHDDLGSMFKVSLDSFSPIVRLPALMCYSYDQDGIRFHGIDQTKRKMV